MRRFFLALSYARRELRAGLKGFYIFLACLALGTAAIAGVQSLSQGLIDSIRYDGRAILGGDIAVRTVYQGVTPQQMKALRKLGVVNRVMETRAMARVPGAEAATLAEVKAVDAFYPLYGKVVLAGADGTEIEGRGVQDILLPEPDPDTGAVDIDKGLYGAAVEKDLLARLGLSVGDDIALGDKVFRIRAVIAREPDKLGGRGFSLAPRVMISDLAFDMTGLGRQGSQVYFDHRMLAIHVTTPAEMKALADGLKAAFPDAQWRVRTAFNASPRLERMVNRLTQFLTLAGLSTLLIGGVGISCAVRSFLDGKMANIATLKCLGAPAGFVTRVYMSMILMLAALGVAMGLAAGAGAAKCAGGLLTARLALTDRTGIYPGALLAAAAFGVLTSLCFSLWPVARAVRVSPRALFRDTVSAAPGGRPSLNAALYTLIFAQALALLVIVTAYDRSFAAGFMALAAGVFALFRLYAAVIGAVLRCLRPPARPELRLALANLHRPGNVSAGVILSLGLGLTVLVATALVEHNFSRLLARDTEGDAPSFFFLDIQPGQKESFRAFLEAEGRARGLQMTPSFRGRILAVNGQDAEAALVDENERWVISPDRGFTWMRDLPAGSAVTAGAWWPADYAGPPVVSISGDVARAFGIGVGAEITVGIFGAPVTAQVVNVRDIDWTSLTMNFAVTFSPGALEKVPANMVATAAVDPAREEEVQAAIVSAFPNVTAVRVREALETAQGLLRGVAQAVRIGAGVTLLGGTLVLAGGIAAARRRHVYDAVVLKVLGASRARILRGFLFEYGILGLLAALAAALLGTGGAWIALTQVMDVDWRFSPGVLAGVTALSLLITVAAGFAGTWRALAQKPAPWLRNQ